MARSVLLVLSVHVHPIKMLSAFPELWDDLLCPSLPILTMNLYALALVHDLNKNTILKVQSPTPFETLSKHRQCPETIEFRVPNTCISLTIRKPYLHHLDAFMVGGIPLKPKEALPVVSFFSLSPCYSAILRVLRFPV